jgi:hypothetical protein
MGEGERGKGKDKGELYEVNVRRKILSPLFHREGLELRGSKEGVYVWLLRPYLRCSRWLGGR